MEKAGIVASVQLRLLEPDEHLSLRGDVLLAAIQQDVMQGLIPFHVRGLFIYMHLICSSIEMSNACFLVYL